jgi:hypothetical protein
MFSQEGERIDSVNVAVPDHMHFAIAYSAIQKGKHVYCQKPLTHDIYEARMLTQAAHRYKVVTQMGNQGASGDGSGSDDNAQPTFKGTIEILSTAAGFIGDWRVGGRTIHVSAATRIETEFGPVAVGAFVEIHGTVRADGSMDATKIETKSNVAGGDGRDELKGSIEALPGTGGFIGDWRVSSRTVHVSADTIINQEHGAAAVGASVEVAGTQRADGSIDATRIEVQPSSGDSSGEGQSTNVKGAIQSLPSSSLVGDWTVGGRLVHVVSSTKFNAEHGAFVVGARVKVKGMQMADGSVVATKVQLRDSN